MLSDLLMWNKIGRIVVLLAERLDIRPERALELFYSSKTNERLHDSATLLYTFSDRYIVDEIMNELSHATSWGDYNKGGTNRTFDPLDDSKC